ncbi:SDR family NAD(P)-dependent oxidoreductase [Prosthecomicrobium sp. N25]|uniref:SDR family NAD(P)-dependent oxidoreductase n=1 Tax=Prosthecomicrobium sp. N25 TaxID=3129254 RepID=UPI003076EE6D
MPMAGLDLPARVLVAGAAGAIGSALAARLAGAGVSVTGTDLGERPQTSAASDWIAADVTHPGAAETLADAVAPGLGGFVYAAGILDPAPWDVVEPEAMDRIFAVNVKAPFLMARALATRMEPGGAMLFVGSIAALRASPKTPFYGASKAALHHLAATLAVALAPRGIRVNVIAPGLIDTPLSDALDRRLADERGVTIAEVRAERDGAVPLGRRGTPEEVAAAALPLLAREASYTTGSVVFTAGGALAGVT